jgi:hypothetical protein
MDRHVGPSHELLRLVAKRIGRAPRHLGAPGHTNTTHTG